MLKSVLPLAALLVSASFTSAANPTIAWDVGSPGKAAGPRITASGTFTIPAPAGGISYTVNKVVVEIRLDVPAGGPWSAYDASLNQTVMPKTWNYIDLTPRAAGTYQVRARLETTKIDMNTMPPTSQLVNVEVAVKKVTLP